MTDTNIIQIYPDHRTGVPFEGLYLNHRLRESRKLPFVYANFVTSLDGRIAVPHPTRSGLVVPEATANPRDWRLFQELAVQADILISTGRYLRDYADGRAQEILQVYDDPAFADLKDWRLNNGLRPQPDLAVISASLNFPIPPVLTESGRRVVIVTTSQADPERVRELEAQTGKVVTAGDERVTGRQLLETLQQLGYSLIYSAAGPKILHMLLAGEVLDRLYLTLVSRLLGGQPFSTIMDGPLLEPPADLPLKAVYYDPHAIDGLGQLFTVYDRS